MKGKKVHDVLNRLHLAMPTKRDQKVNCCAVFLVLQRASGVSAGEEIDFTRLLLCAGEASVHPGRRLQPQEGNGG